MKSESDLIKDECTVLLDRVLHAQTLTFFGEDGCGKYGRSSTPISCPIRAFDVEIDAYSDDPAEVKATLRIFLDGYSALQTGHAITDLNLRINLNLLLDREHIDREALTWAPVEVQGENFIAMSIDVQKLLAW